MPTWQDYLDTNQERFIQEMLDFDRIPSISSLPDHADDVRRAGQWVMAQTRVRIEREVESLRDDYEPL